MLWILGFLSFGFGTGEFEVTRERLGCYRYVDRIFTMKELTRGPAAPKSTSTTQKTMQTTSTPASMTADSAAQSTRNGNSASMGAPG